MQVCPRCGFRDAVSIAEAAEKLGVSGQTVRNWARDGKVKTVLVDGRLAIAQDVLKSAEVRKLARESRKAGELAKAGRAKAAAAR